ncbi:DUF6266 family protein [Odoribacter lunatus]|uniref:DUF6266 family protein n=1 Tax=Odoribacter lunatus TaxID=2941335 RepID=UPI00203F823F|nr:DUF6266 family protein [Odoribacter lunatus]
MGINSGSQTIGLQKSVGSLTYYTWKGLTISRVKVMSNPSRTDLQVKNRSIQGVVGHLCRRLIEAIRIGYTIREKYCSPANLFVKANRSVATATKDEETGEFLVSVDFARLKLADGDLFPPALTAVVDKEGRKVVFTLAAAEEGGRVLPDDVVYAVIYEKKRELCRMPLLGKRVETGEKEVKLSEQCDMDDLEIYAFAVNEKKRLSSPSVYLSV